MSWVWIMRASLAALMIWSIYDTRCAMYREDGELDWRGPTVFIISIIALTLTFFL